MRPKCKPVPLLTETQITRFWSRVSKRGDDCWEWIGGRLSSGYGYFAIDHYNYMAHRVAYELLVAPIPAGLVIDHLCRNRSCVNPLHMEPVTDRENVLRGNALSNTNRAKTHCKAGHEFTSENTILGKGRFGTYRVCRRCRREYQRHERSRQRANSDQIHTDAAWLAAMQRRPDGTTCKHGHVFSPDMGRVIRTPGGFSRICTICEYERHLRYQRRKRSVLC